MQKTKIKKILAFCSMASVLFLMGGSQAFASLQTINEATGFASDNDVIAAVTDGFASLNQNAQVIANVGNGAITSGDNTVLDNTLPGSAATGAVILDGRFSNNSNANTLDRVGSFFFDPISENSITGAESDNDSTTLLDQSIGASNFNDADVASTIAIDGASGDNIVSENTGLGGVATGDIDGVLSTDTTVNTNFLRLADLTPIAAAVTGALNDITGFESVNDAEVTVDDSIGAENTNDADIDNNIFAVLNSGENIISENTGRADILTGDVFGDTAIGNDVNANQTIVTMDSGNPVTTASNSRTGAESANNASADIDQTVGVSNTNTADIDNTVNTVAMSGANRVFGNTGLVTMGTGDASNDVAIVNGNVANTNSTTIDLGGGVMGVAAANDITGFGSVNNAEVDLDTGVAASNENLMNVDNSVDSVSQTGGNVVDFNGGAGVSAVVTGDASTDTVIANNLNNNVTAVAINPTGDVLVSNSVTGPESVNNASADIHTNVADSNTNDAIITNTINSVSNSGGNEVLGNTSGGLISTGAAVLGFGVENTGNSNETVVGQ